MASQFLTIIRCLMHGQHGITGLETAIVLIAFVVVSSVFAFSALSAGMFASDKSREAHDIGLSQTRTSMELKGLISGDPDTIGVSGVITDIRFYVGLSAGGGTVDLTPGSTIIMYTDNRQNKIFGSTAGFTVSGVGSADADNLLERNEVYEIRMLNLGVTGSGNDTLTYTLGVNQTFTLEVIPVRGSVLQIERTTPIYLDLINFLQ